MLVWTRPALGALLALTVAQTATLVEYVDPRGRFRFTYPSTFGTPYPGTNDGFGDRLAALRFERLSTELGGEAALTRGFPLVDLQAVGGLYDSIALEVFTDDIRSVLLRTLPPLDATNFCGEIAKARHLDLTVPLLATLSPQQRAAIAGVDAMRNVDPIVIRCDRQEDTVVFDKEVRFQAGSPRQHVYGAVRFLSGQYSTFQIVRGGAAPSSVVLDQMVALVRSWRSQ